MPARIRWMRFLSWPELHSQTIGRELTRDLRRRIASIKPDG
jgi:hypothetical protein